MVILALSIREKFNVPVGCDLSIVSANGHVAIGSSFAPGGKYEQCLVGTTLRWYSRDMSSKSGVPLINMDAVPSEPNV